MDVPGKKYCDICGEEIAVKHSILYHTERPYVTLRMDKPVTYVNYEENTTKSKIHLCLPCWFAMCGKVKQSLKEMVGDTE